ncbi:MAG: SlyX family protein [Treponema sp.]
MEKETEQRIIELETKIAYMQNFIDEIQTVTVEHTETIEKLRKENQILSGRLQDLIDNMEEIPNRKPPHY